MSRRRQHGFHLVIVIEAAVVVEVTDLKNGATSNGRKRKKNKYLSGSSVSSVAPFLRSVYLPPTSNASKVGSYSARSASSSGPVTAARVATAADRIPAAAMAASKTSNPDSRPAAAARQPGRRHRDDRAAGAGGEPRHQQEQRLGPDHHRDVPRVVADGAQQRQLAPALEHVPEHHRGEPDRPEQQPEPAQRLERREVGVLDPVKRVEPLDRAHRVDAERLQILLDDLRQLSAPGRRCGHPAHRSGRSDTLPGPGTAGRTAPPPSPAPPAARCRAARRRNAASPALRAPVSIVIVSPTAACRTYCSDVASAITGTVPSEDGRRSSSQGLARSCSVSASEAAKVKRRSSRNESSGATIVGLPGR